MSRLGFHLIRESPPPPSEALAALLAHAPPLTLHDHQRGSESYQPSPRLRDAMNVALAVGAPLLLTGEPDTGKTQAAWYLSRYFDVKVYDFTVRSVTTARDLKYQYDAVGYLQEAQHPAAERRPRKHFLEKGPLWRAYEDPAPCVLLIDEIDKAPRDFPNDLLQELGVFRFTHPWEPDVEIGRPEGSRPPIVVITSNAERRMPDAFLRRCVVHHIELSRPQIDAIVRVRAGTDYPGLAEPVRAAAIERFWQLRDEGLDLEKPPSTAELLAWLAVLDAWGKTEDDIRTSSLADLPASGALVKLESDRKKLVERG